MTHFSRNLLILRKNKKISQKDLGEVLGVLGNTISNYEKGVSYPDFNTLVALSNYFDINLDILLKDDVTPNNLMFDNKDENSNAHPNVNLNVNPNVNLIDKNESNTVTKQEGNEYSIPIYNIFATAGNVNQFDDNKESIIGYLNSPAFSKCIGFVRVTGDSMEPVFKSGDYIGLIPQEDLELISFGQAFLVITTDDQKLLKYIRRHKEPKKLILRSENPQFDDIDIAVNKISKLYKIKGFIRET